MTYEQAGVPSGKAKTRVPRFSLKTLLIVITLFCIGFGPWAYRANRQRLAVKAITGSGGEFWYSYQAQPSPNGIGNRYSSRVEPPGPNWLRRLLGDDYFITPVRLMITGRDEIDGDCLSHLEALTHLEEMWFDDVDLRDADVAHLKHLKKLRLLNFVDGTLTGPNRPRQFHFLKHLSELESLSLSDSEFADRDAVNLGGMVALRQLFLYNTALGDDGLIHLQNLHNLELLGLSQADITDLGIAHISHLQKLRYLSLNHCRITDSAIRHFSKMSGLRELELHNTTVTPDGLDRMRKAMPRCKINGKGRDGTVIADDPFS